jgi:hypothetical protein
LLSVCERKSQPRTKLADPTKEGVGSGQSEWTFSQWGGSGDAENPDVER